MTDDIPTLRAKLQQLKAQHDSGALGSDAYDAAKAKVERELVDHVLAGADAPAPPAETARPTKTFLTSLVLAVLVVAGAGYWWTGSPGQSGSRQAAGAGAGVENPHDANAEEFAAAVDKLAQKLQEQPDNADGWAMLARSYARLGRMQEALPAFQKAAALHDKDAALLADYADVMAVVNGRNLDGEPMKLIERALQIEPENLKALSLAGTAAFNRKDFAGAVRHWEKMARAAPPDSPFLQQVLAGIAEARQLGGLPAPAQPAATGMAAAAKPAEAAPTAAAGKVLRGTVRLAPALVKQASPTDTVFILARPAEGSRMPLAIMRKQVRDLPIEFTLDDSSAMSPATRLSLFPKVVVSARVTKSGQAAAVAGDLTGETPAVAHDASGLLIEINAVVKN